jgi:hypothetical protein
MEYPIVYAHLRYDEIRSLPNESNTIKNGRLRPRLIDLGLVALEDVVDQRKPLIKEEIKEEIKETPKTPSNTIKLKTLTPEKRKINLQTQVISALAIYVTYIDMSKTKDNEHSPRRFNPTIASDGNPTEPIGSFDRPLKLAPGTNLLKLLISSRGRSKPTDSFRRIPTLGSHRIPTLGIRMSVHNPESDRIRCRIL